MGANLGKMFVTATVVSTLPELIPFCAALYGVLKVDVLPEVVVCHLVLGLPCMIRGC